MGNIWNGISFREKVVMFVLAGVHEETKIIMTTSTSFS